MTPWLIAAAVFFLLAQHPFITYPLSLWCLRRVRPAPPTEPEPVPLRFAICVCAYNEEKVIEAKIANLLALQVREPETQLLVYVDAAVDRTTALLEPYQDRLRLHVAQRRHGKTHGMNLLVKLAQADIIVFTDANVEMDLQALTNLRRHFADPSVGCVCGNLTYVNAHDSVTAYAGSLYWRLEQTIKSLEQTSGSATASIMGADGSLFAIRRELHQPPPDHLIDDMYVSLRVLCDGHRVIQAEDVRAYENTGTRQREEFQRKVRIACQAFNVHRTLWPQLRRLEALTVYKYVSHKLLRWLCIYFLGLTALCASVAIAVGFGWFIAVAVSVAITLVLWIGQRWALKPFAQVTDVLVNLAGAGVGVWQSLRGAQYQTWRPSNSARDAA